MQKENAPLVDDEQAPDEIYPETPVIVTMRLGPGHSSSSQNRVMSGAAFRSAIIVASNGAGAADSD